MKVHLSRSHNDSCRVVATEGPCGNFKKPFSKEILFGHLRSHLRSHEMVACPFKNCNYKTNSYSGFNAHKSRTHGGDSNFGECVVLVDNHSAQAVVAESLGEPAESDSAGSVDTFDLDKVNSQCDTDTLKE